ncbi:hypothetical protein CRE_01430 [Caenorhabditis remanei]|uniref:Uncharacterized protein n=1 Tax=Caenorhabditis remanei TaxID=31234 RepID=E3NLD8_CAERE|nr:hypothetical protein CRE_01430 [Caenorhabditis remanei]
MLTGILVYLYFILQAVIVFIVAIDDDSKWSHDFFIKDVAGMFLLALITLGIYQLSRCLDTVQKWCKIKILQRCKNTMMFGFILIFALSLFGKLAALKMKTKPEDSFVALATMPLIIAVYFGFCFSANRKFKPSLAADKSWTMISVIISSHAYFLYYTIEKALTVEEPMCTAVVLLQVFISLFGAGSTLDIYIYLKEKFVDQNEEEVSLESVKIMPRELEMKSQNAEEKPIEVIFIGPLSDNEDSDFDVDDNSLYCEICHLGRYTRIPRVLVLGGHIICEECFEKLLRKDRERDVSCQ